MSLQEGTFRGLMSTNSGRKKITCHIKLEPGEIKLLKNQTRTTKKSKTNNTEIYETFPLDLVWLNSESHLKIHEEDEFIVRRHAFEILVPNLNFVFGTGSVQEKLLWVASFRQFINDYLVLKGMTPDSDVRKGYYFFPNVGTYDGMWLKGQMHGEGTFLSITGVTYKGQWHSVMRAGFGQIFRDPANTLDNVGWEYSVPFTGVTASETEEMRRNKKQPVPSKLEIDVDVNVDEVLTKRDIEQLLLSKSVELIEYDKDSIIIQSSKKNTHIFRIKSGEVHLNKARKGERITTEILKPPMMFGEMAIFDQITYGNFTAATDVELYVMDIAEIYRIFVVNYELSKRFNFQIAKTLAVRLLYANDRVSEGETSVTSKEEISVTDPDGVRRRNRVRLSSADEPRRTRLHDGPSQRLKEDFTLSSDGIFIDPTSEETVGPIIESPTNSGSMYVLNANSPPGELSNSDPVPLESPHFSETQELLSSSGYVGLDFPNSEFPILESPKFSGLIHDFPVWSTETWTSIMKLFSDDVIYRDPFTGGSIFGKIMLSEYKDLILSRWSHWSWQLDETVISGSTTIQKCLLSLSAATTNITLVERAVIWTSQNDNKNISKCDIYFDTSQILVEEKNFPISQNNLPIISLLTSPKFGKVSKTPELHEKAGHRSRSHSGSKEGATNTKSKSKTLPKSGPSSIENSRKIPEIVKKDPSEKKNQPLTLSTQCDLRRKSDGGNKEPRRQESKVLKPKRIDKRDTDSEDGLGLELLDFLGELQKSDVKAEVTPPPNESIQPEKSKQTPKMKRGYTVSSHQRKGVVVPVVLRSETSVLLSKDRIPKTVNSSPRIQTLRPLKRQKSASRKEIHVQLWSEKFELPDCDKNDSLIHEFRCQFDTGSKLPTFKGSRRYGTLYISTKFVCYSSEVFAITTKEVIPIKCIETIKTKDDSNAIKIRINRKLIVRFKLRFLVSCSQVILSFATHSEASEAALIINKLLENCEHDDELDGDSPRVPQESFIQREINASTLDTSIPNIELSCSKSTPAIRLYGPKLDQGETLTLGYDICVTSISTYPYLSTLNPDGSVTVMTERLGDPICDQFCVERYQNRTIFALSDGCNWGPKVRSAAKIAAQTFVEYSKKTIFDVETTQATTRAFLQAFAHAHNRIIEGKEDKWWECATTTLLGGSILEVNDPLHKWAFTCVSVGDCKAFHIHFKNPNHTSVADITQGSRTGLGSLDARDCGGRLGPYKKGNPDLRNLSAFFQFVDEDDFIVIVSDGVYDNLDPQSLGLDLAETGLPTTARQWMDLETSQDVELMAAVERYKTEYMTNYIRKLLDEMMVKNSLQPHEVQCRHISQTLIQHCLDITEKSRVFMEQNPGSNQPDNYKDYPGKVDHTTCIVIKVGRTSFRQWESDLGDLVVRLRHPTYGITKEAEGTQKGTFFGSDLVKWISKDPEYSEMAQDFPQALMNFNYIGTVTAQDSFIFETFHPDFLYQFKVYVPIMTDRDWRIILKGTTRKSFLKDDIIIPEGSENNQIYHIVYGMCRIEKKITGTTPRTYSTKGTTAPSSPRYKHQEEPKLEPKSKTTQTLGIIGAPQTLGEISLLMGGKATASVIAESDEVEVLILERSFINIMFVRYPDMAGRFYHYLASVLARRLSFHESGNAESIN